MFDNDRKICFIYSTPKKSEPSDVKRGDIALLVTHRPGEQKLNVQQLRDKVAAEATLAVFENYRNLYVDVKKEIETIVKIKIEKFINKADLVKRDEFEILKLRVDKLTKNVDEFKKSRKSYDLKSKKKLKKRNK